MSGTILAGGTRSIKDVTVASSNSQIRLIYAHSNLPPLTRLRWSLRIKTKAILPAELFGNIAESVGEIPCRISLELSGACPFSEVSEIAIGLLVVGSARAYSASARAASAATAHPT
ncbi:MAG: hypothetical protein LC770_00080 [Acidobacteria bacterium]|nr:hypothetical protein [Acidobacteriota bacterium]